MDFIDGLPSSQGHDTIMVVVDRLSKYAHFVPLKHPYTALSVAKAFVANIVRLHGMPLSIVSDRDSLPQQFLAVPFPVARHCSLLQLQLSSSVGWPDRGNKSYP